MDSREIRTVLYIARCPICPATDVPAVLADGSEVDGVGRFTIKPHGDDDCDAGGKYYATITADVCTEDEPQRQDRYPNDFSNMLRLSGLTPHLTPENGATAVAVAQDPRHALAASA